MGPGLRLAAAVGLPALLLLAAAPSAPSAEPAPGLLGRLEGHLLAAAGGDLDAVGTLRLGDPGAPTARPVSLRAFLAHAEGLLGGMPGPPGEHVTAPPEVVGAGSSSPELQRRLGWPYCEQMALFVLHRGPPGATFRDLERGLERHGVLCGGFWGPSAHYIDVTMAPRDVPLLTPPCAAAEVMAPAPEAPIGAAGGIACGWASACLSGMATVVSFTFFDVTLDYVLATDGTLAAGADPLDPRIGDRAAPACVPSTGVPLGR